jgi:chromosome segregation ATPase
MEQKNEMSFAKIREEFGTALANIREEFGTSLAKIREEFGTSLANMREEFGTSLASMREEYGKSFAKIETEIKHIHQTLAKLPCEERRKETEASINQLKEEHHTLEKKVDKIENQIVYIQRDLSELVKDMNVMKGLGVNLANSSSPLSLTDEGLDHAKCLDAENVVNKNWDRIYSDLEENTSSDMPLYDIQQYIIDNMPLKYQQYFEKEDVLKLKEYAFVKGKSIYTFFIIYSLITRDKYFKQKGLL